MDELDKWFEWRDRQRQRPRTMTLGEYECWCRGGDMISDPTTANAFPGGLTITFSGPAIIGRFADDGTEGAGGK